MCIMPPMAKPLESPVQDVTSFLECLRLDTLWSRNGPANWLILFVAICAGYAPAADPAYAAHAERVNLRIVEELQKAGIELGGPMLNGER